MSLHNNKVQSTVEHLARVEQYSERASSLCLCLQTQQTIHNNTLSPMNICHCVIIDSVDSVTPVSHKETTRTG